MKTDLKTPLKIHGSDDKDALYDAEGTYLAAVSSLQLLPMIEVVRRANSFDALVEALEQIAPVIAECDPDTVRMYMPVVKAALKLVKGEQ